jgi:hypothetical protein
MRIGSRSREQNQCGFKCNSFTDPGAHLDPDPYVFGPPGPASESVSQSYGSEDPDQHPDPYQNVTDPQHCFCKFFFKMGQFVLNYIPGRYTFP